MAKFVTPYVKKKYFWEEEAEKEQDLKSSISSSSRVPKLTSKPDVSFSTPKTETVPQRVTAQTPTKSLLDIPKAKNFIEGGSMGNTDMTKTYEPISTVTQPRTGVRESIKQSIVDYPTNLRADISTLGAMGANIAQRNPLSIGFSNVAQVGKNILGDKAPEYVNKMADLKNFSTDYAEKQTNKANELRSTTTASKEAITQGKFGLEVAYDITQMLPDLASTLVLSSLGAAKTASTVAKNAPKGLALVKSVFSKEGMKKVSKEVVKKLAVQPEMIPMGTRILAQSYQDNINSGSSHERALATAIVNAYGQSILEGGGAQDLVKKGGTKEIVKLLKTSLGEGFEEISQGVWESAVNTAIGGREFDLNASDLAYSGLLGFAAGGGLGGAAAVATSMKSNLPQKAQAIVDKYNVAKKSSTPSIKQAEIEALPQQEVKPKVTTEQKKQLFDIEVARAQNLKALKDDVTAKKSDIVKNDSDTVHPRFNTEAIKKEAEKLYREVGVDRLESYFNRDLFDAPYGSNNIIQVAKDPSYALGQDLNKGIMLQFKDKNIPLKLSQKPNNPDLEFDVDDGRRDISDLQGKLRENLEKIVVNKNLIGDVTKEEVDSDRKFAINKARFNTVMINGYLSRWDKTIAPNGDYIFTKPTETKQITKAIPISKEEVKAEAPIKEEVKSTITDVKKQEVAQMPSDIDEEVALDDYEASGMDIKEVKAERELEARVKEQLLDDADVEAMIEAFSKKASTKKSEPKVEVKEVKAEPKVVETKEVKQKKVVIAREVTANAFENQPLYEKQLAQNDKTMTREFEKLKGKSFILESTTSDNALIVHPRNGGFQATVIDKNNEPMSDRQFKSYEDFVADFKKDPTLGGNISVREVTDNAPTVVKSETPKSYRYELTQRPPGPGSIPSGAKNVVSYDAKTDGSWGYVEYAKPLTSKQISEYELSEQKPSLKDVVETITKPVEAEPKEEAPYVSRKEREAMEKAAEKEAKASELRKEGNYNTVFESIKSYEKTNVTLAKFIPPNKVVPDRADAVGSVGTRQWQDKSTEMKNRLESIDKSIEAKGKKVDVIKYDKDVFNDAYRFYRDEQDLKPVNIATINGVESVILENKGKYFAVNKGYYDYFSTAYAEVRTTNGDFIFFYDANDNVMAMVLPVRTGESSIQALTDYNNKTKATTKEVVQRMTKSEEQPQYSRAPKKEPTTSSDKASKETVRLSDLSKIIETYLDIPVREGKMNTPKDVLGLFKPKQEVIRLRNLKDAPTMFHEVGHFFDKHEQFYNKLDDTQKNELYTAGKPVAGDLKDYQKIVQEGVAEFFSSYVANREAAQYDFPESYEVMDKMVQSNSTYKDLIELLNYSMETYSQMDPVQRINSNVITETGKKSYQKQNISKIVDHAYAAAIDANFPIYKALMEVELGKQFSSANLVQLIKASRAMDKIAPSKNPITQRRLSATAGIGKFVTAMERGIIDPKTDEFIGEGFYDIIKDVQKEKRTDDLIAYLIALRAKELKARKVETGIDGRDVTSVLQKFENDKLLNETVKKLYKFQQTMLKVALKNNMMTQDDYDRMTEANKFYIPFNRDMSTAFKEHVANGQGGNLFNRMKGSTRDILNPLEGILRNTYKIYNAIEKNDSLKVFHEFILAHEGHGKVAEAVPTPMKVVPIPTKEIIDRLSNADIDVDQDIMDAITKEMDDMLIFRPGKYGDKENILHYMKDGKNVYVEIGDKEVYDALTSTHVFNLGIIGDMLNVPAKILRAGATEISDAFIVQNLLVDTVSAAVFSQAGFIPGLSSIKGLYRTIYKDSKSSKKNADDMYYKAISAGLISNSVSALENDYLKKDQRALYERDIKEKTISKITHPFEAMRMMNEFVEKSTRMGEFEAMYKKNIEKGMSERDARLDAALKGRDLLDFMRAGWMGKELNRVIPFFNSSLQGTDKLVRSIVKHPVRTNMNAMLSISLVSLINAIINRDDEEIQSLDQYVKDMYWVVRLGDELIKIKKPYTLGLLYGSSIERTLDYIYNNDRNAYDGYASRLIESMTLSLTPQFMKLSTELKHNYSDFYQGQIVPDGLDKKKPMYQYNASTSETSKALGKIFNISPMKLDYMISGTLGSSGKLALKTMDAVLGLTGVTQEVDAPKQNLLSYIPIARAFDVSPYTQSKYVKKFYEKKEEVTQDKDTYMTEMGEIPEEFKEEADFMVEMSGYMTKVNKKTQEILKSELTSKQKQEEILKLQDYKNLIAKSYLEEKELDTETIKEINNLSPKKSKLQEMIDELEKR